MIYRAPDGSKEEVRDFWNRNVCQADLPGSEVGTREFFDEVEAIRYKYHYHLQPIFKKIKEVTGTEGRLLEVGCGMGTDLIQLARMDISVTGVDLTESGIEMAKRRFEIYDLEAELKVADAENLPFEDESFDVVYSFGVLHHTPDTKKAISETQRVLKPGGKAFIMFYYKPSLNYLAHWVTGVPFDGSKKDKCPVERAYTKREIRNLFDMYSEVHIDIDYLFGTGWGIMNSMTPIFIHRAFGKIIGWHAMIEGTKKP